MSNQITPNPSVPTQVVAEVKFPRWINNLGIIPTSYKDSMSYYECLAWLCKFLEETVIPSVNENGEAVEELQNLYVELNSYVTNYFENLNVQEEINKKLDQMAETGLLDELIGRYINEDILPIINEQTTILNTSINTQNQRISNVERKINAATSGSPAGVYATVQDLTADNPDHDRIYLVLSDGNWYYYNTSTSSWAAGGVYQSTSFPEVEDIRKAWNRIIYDSAGNSVRTQVKNNRDILDQIVVKHESKNYYNKNDITTTSDNQYLSNAIYVEPNDHFYFSGHVNDPTQLSPLNCWGCYFYDGAMNLISQSANWIKEITVPDNNNIVFMKVKFPETNYQYVMFEKNNVTRQWQDYFEPYYTLADENIREEIENINTNIDNINTKLNNINNEIFVLPEKIYNCVGQEYNIYYENILKNSDKNTFAGCDISGALSNCERFSDRLIWKPQTAGQTNINIDLYKDNWSDKTKSKSVKMVAAPKSTGTSTVSTIFIGDSKIAHGQTVRYLSQLFDDDNMTLNLMGSRYDNNNTGDPRYKHDGFGGWTTFNFVHSPSVNNVVNPFYNTSTNIFDFSYYMNNQGYDAVDYVFILLGTNDFYTSSADIISDTNIMINSIKAFNENIKIIIGLNEGDYFPKKEWRTRNIKFLDFNQAKIDTYQNQIENVYVLPLYINIDLYQDYPLTNVPLSQADEMTNSGKTRIFCQDGIHQNNTGFYKMAQAVYGLIKCDKASLL